MASRAACRFKVIGSISALFCGPAQRARIGCLRRPVRLPVEIARWRADYIEKLVPQPQELVALGFSMMKRAPINS